MVETRVSEMTTVWIKDNMIWIDCLQAAVMMYHSVGATRSSAQEAPRYTIDLTCKRVRSATGETYRI